MTSYDFIFSEKLPFRLSRHVIFWVLVFVSYVVLTGTVYITGLTFENPFAVQDLIHELHKSDFSLRVVDAINYVILVIIYTYLVAYVLLPYYLIKKKYVPFWSWLFVLTLVAEIIRLYQMGLRYRTPFDEALTMFWVAALTFVNLGPPILCGLFITIKVVKNWYVKDSERLALVRENSNAELQLLKAQIHPHFLFNTLNNIYAFSLNQSSKAPELVSKLSDMLKYMINDCQASLVSVEKEIKMVQDYIGLEKVRYGNRLRLEVSITGNLQDKFVAPLMLIPFIENSFKHGTSRMLVNSWLRLSIDLSNEALRFTLMNSKPLNSSEINGRKGIGLANVRKRLLLLYPDRHALRVEAADESFTVEMQLPLHGHPDFSNQSGKSQSIHR